MPCIFYIPSAQRPRRWQGGSSSLLRHTGYTSVRVELCVLIRLRCGGIDRHGGRPARDPLDDDRAPHALLGADLRAPAAHRDDTAQEAEAAQTADGEDHAQHDQHGEGHQLLVGDAEVVAALGVVPNNVLAGLLGAGLVAQVRVPQAGDQGGHAGLGSATRDVGHIAEHHAEVQAALVLPVGAVAEVPEALRLVGPALVENKVQPAGVGLGVGQLHGEEGGHNGEHSRLADH